jgi:hypothetical protein
MSRAMSRTTEILGELRRRKFVFLQTYEPGDEALPLAVAQFDYVRMLYTWPHDPTGEALSVGYAPGHGWSDPLVPPGFTLRYYELDAAEYRRELEHGFEERAHP